MDGKLTEKIFNINKFYEFITEYREFFAENFPQAPQPRIAVNFDSFGHTRGLVQILKKSGYEGYVFCRPMPEIL